MKKLFFCIAILLTAAALVCSSCSDGNLPADDPDTGANDPEAPVPTGPLTAIKAYSILDKYVKENWTEDAVMLFLSMAEEQGELIIEEGGCRYWFAEFYSPSRKQSWIFKIDHGIPSKEGAPNMKNITLVTADWSTWKVDSSEVLEIAAENGFTGIKHVILSALENGQPQNPPAQVAEWKTVYWKIEDDHGQKIYVQAGTAGVLIP